MTELSRRSALSALAVAAAAPGCGRAKVEASGTDSAEAGPTKEPADGPWGSPDLVKRTFSLPHGRPWPTPDPFLFCVHHDDRYPRGNGSYGPAATLEGRDMGRDFAWKDGWNMYHGRDVPGFPAHPHRGFETVTVVRKGRLDHADSLGASARYGDGDVQWLTAGSGIQHAEMFPLLSAEEENPLDLFQIWLNLPRKSKMVRPYFSMLWAHTIPSRIALDAAGKKVTITARAGSLGDLAAPPPPPDSWAADPKNEVGIFTVDFERGATWTLPAASAGVSRHLYFFRGSSLRVGTQTLSANTGADLVASLPASLRCEEGGEVLVLQGRPIGEPVAKNGPFVMNTQAEIRQAYEDYRSTRFGGWPWDNSGPVHGSDPTRFARREDGKTERPG